MSLIGHRDVDLKMLSELDDKDLLTMCSTNKDINKLCHDESFWMNRTQKKFGSDIPKPTRVNWRNYYLGLIYYLDKYANDIDTGIYNTSLEGMKNIDFINYMLTKSPNSSNLGLYGAARRGDKDLIDFFISKGARNWNLAMSGAAYAGSQELVDFFIRKGANSWDQSIFNAAAYGHQNLVDFFISIGVDINRGLYAAVLYGRKNLVEHLVSKGANDWESALEAARRGRHANLVEYFLLKLKP